MVNNYKVQSMKDQFINASLLVKRQPSSVDQKTEIIKALESKNYKLKTQLLKIQRTIEQIKGEQMEVDSPKRRQSIFQWQENVQVLTKQMINSYQKIKMYEYQINKLQKEYQDKIVMKQKAKQLQIVIKEKKVMNERLKQQLIKQQKITQENMKKLQNNSQHQQTELYLKRLNEEASFYKEKIIIFEKKELIKIKNMKKQYQTLKQVQNHLLQIGLAGGELEQLKHRALKGVNNGKRSISQRLIHKQISNPTYQEEDQIEDRTREYYQTILGEITLLQKMKNNHQKQITQIQMEKEEAINKNNNSLTKLTQCQKEIQNLEKDISTTKNKVIPSNLKPLNIKRSVSSYQGQNIHKIEPIKSQQAKSNRIGHLLKFDQIGFLSAKGQRFTDRNLLGKYNVYAKITGIKIFIERLSGLFGGIQVAYDGQKGGEYVKKDKQAKVKQYIEQQYICKENALIKSISGTLNHYSQIQSLSVTSSDGTKHKFGASKTTQKPFNFSINSEQYPTCLFGSLIIIKQSGKREFSLIEHLGFEIQSINFSTQSSINLMNEQIHQ